MKHKKMEIERELSFSGMETTTWHENVHITYLVRSNTNVHKEHVLWYLGSQGN